MNEAICCDKKSNFEILIVFGSFFYKSASVILILTNQLKDNVAGFYLHNDYTLFFAEKPVCLHKKFKNFKFLGISLFFENEHSKTGIEFNRKTGVKQLPHSYT